MRQASRGKHRAGEAGPSGSRLSRRILAFALAVLGAWAVLYVVGRNSSPGSEAERTTSLSGRSSSPATGSPWSSAGGESVSVGTLPGQQAPDFSIQTAEGQVFRLSSHRGRAVVLDFLAPGCQSCALEVSALTKAWEAFTAKGVTVLLVDVGGGPAQEAVAYYRSLGGGDFLYAADKGFKVATEYKVFALGTTVIVDPRGIVSFLDSGPTPTDILDREIRKALA